MGKRVLVVDDDPTLIRLCELILGREGHQVVGALSGAECLNSLRQGAVDLILLDLLLDDTDGWTLLEKIRANDHWSSIPVIVVTGLSRKQTANQLSDRSLAGYIVKPFQVTKFLDQVRNTLNNGYLY